MYPKVYAHSLLSTLRGWLGVAKVSVILRHQSIQIILASSWARLAILVAGKGRGGTFFFLFWFFTFIPVHLTSLSLSFISSTISFHPFSERRHKMTHKVWRVVKPNTSTLSTLTILEFVVAPEALYERLWTGPVLFSMLIFFIITKF